MPAPPLGGPGRLGQREARRTTRLIDAQGEVAERLELPGSRCGFPLPALGPGSRPSPRPHCAWRRRPAKKVRTLRVRGRNIIVSRSRRATSWASSAPRRHRHSTVRSSEHDRGMLTSYTGATGSSSRTPTRTASATSDDRRLMAVAPELVLRFERLDARDDDEFARSSTVGPDATSRSRRAPPTQPSVRTRRRGICDVTCRGTRRPDWPRARSRCVRRGRSQSTQLPRATPGSSPTLPTRRRPSSSYRTRASPTATSAELYVLLEEGARLECLLDGVARVAALPRPRSPVSRWAPHLRGACDDVAGDEATAGRGTRRSSRPGQYATDASSSRTRRCRRRPRPARASRCPSRRPSSSACWTCSSELRLPDDAHRAPRSASAPSQ